MPVERVPQPLEVLLAARAALGSVLRDPDAPEDVGAVGRWAGSTASVPPS
ncbi:hypothetical protein ACFY3N_06245 [Streptomyces sp. NPDC000348]